MLLADWFAQLARDSGLGLAEQRGSSDQSFILGVSNAFHVRAHFIEAYPFLDFVASDAVRQSDVDAIVREAVARIERGDLGDGVWYSTQLREVAFSPLQLGRFLQHLGAQTRIKGWLRLGANILLEFTEELPPDWDEKKAIFAPKAVVHVHIAVPGPCEGFFTSHFVYGVVEAVAAICTFALGRCVALPPMVFSSKPETLPQLTALKTNRNVHSLAREHVSLDIFSPLKLPGGFDFFARSRAALMTFEAAMREERDSLACVLYVAAAECLTTPNTDWRREKLTKRFIKFFDELMPNDLDQIVAHAKFEETFGIRRGKRKAPALRRDLLDHIYDYRSGPLHEGLRPSYGELGMVRTSMIQIAGGFSLILLGARSCGISLRHV